MKQIGSVTITSAATPVSGIGMPRGEHGLATHDVSRVAAWLANQRPADMDAAAVSRASSHGVGLTVRYEHRFPTGPNGEGLPSYAVAVGCGVEGNGDGIAAALADLRNFMTPAPARQIEAWLAELSVLAPKRQDDEFTEELRLVSYASRLSRYPADVVRDVLLGRAHRFFPSWFELERLCNAATGPRKQMIAALERGPARQHPPRRPPTDEEKERIRSLVNALFPMRSQEMRDAAMGEMTKGDCMKGEE